MLLKICVLIFVLALPFSAIYDWINPWQPAVRALAEYPNQKRICVGFGSEKLVEVSGQTRNEKSDVQRSFLLVPSAFVSPKIISIAEDQDGKISNMESSLGFWIWFFLYMLCLFGTWRFWIRTLLRAKCGA